MIRDNLEKVFGGRKWYFRFGNYLLSMCNAGPEFKFDIEIDGQ